MPTGKISKVTRSSSGVVFDLQYESTNPSPPPPTITVTETFPTVPEWAWHILEANVGKTATITQTGTPPSISSVSVTA